MGRRNKKSRRFPRNKTIEVINFTKKTHRVIKLNDDAVVFDEKTGTHHILPVKKPNYDEDGDTKKEN
jgi:translation elongation factor P/translation initiation factor 5A|tara:strand:- start:6471 stop:6671 length:201 start_codon:yes stop_codon:yes gene_type:complete